MKTYLIWREQFSHRITTKFNLSYLQARFNQFGIMVMESDLEPELSFGGDYE